MGRRPQGRAAREDRVRRVGSRGVAGRYGDERELHTGVRHAGGRDSAARVEVGRKAAVAAGGVGVGREVVAGVAVAVVAGSASGCCDGHLREAGHEQPVASYGSSRGHEIASESQCRKLGQNQQKN